MAKYQTKSGSFSTPLPGTMMCTDSSIFWHYVFKKLLEGIDLLIQKHEIWRKIPPSISNIDSV